MSRSGRQHRCLLEWCQQRTRRFHWHRFEFWIHCTIVREAELRGGWTGVRLVGWLWWRTNPFHFHFSPYNLTTALYAETETQKYASVVVVIRADSSIERFENLRGKKACIAEFGSIGKISGHCVQFIWKFKLIKWEQFSECFAFVSSFGGVYQHGKESWFFFT